MRHRHSCRVSEGDSEEEKLVEWIAGRLCYYYELGHRKGTPAMFSDQEARAMIARIGKAYADGELELPGEVGRGRVTTILYGGIQTKQGLDLLVREGNILIALSGTGKEES